MWRRGCNAFVFRHTSECGTWSHAVIPSLGARARGGVVARPRSVSHVVRPRQGLGFEGLGWVPLGPKRARQGPVWSCTGPYISRTLIRDSRVIRQGLSGPVGSYRVSDGFPSEPCFDTTGPEGSRRIPRLSRIDARWMYGPIRDPPASPWGLKGPVGTRRAPGGPPAAPSDPVS